MGIYNLTHSRLEFDSTVVHVISIHTPEMKTSSALNSSAFSQWEWLALLICSFNLWLQPLNLTLDRNHRSANSEHVSSGKAAIKCTQNVPETDRHNHSLFFLSDITSFRNKESWEWQKVVLKNENVEIVFALPVVTALCVCRLCGV